MQPYLAFDVYGTLVDPLGMSDLLASDARGAAQSVSALWREKQLEFAFRKGLMRAYEDFGACTRQALRYAMASHGLTLTKKREDELMSAYLQLPAFDDALPALRALEGNYLMFAFSNGTQAALKKVLGHNDMLPLFDGLVSVDEIKSFKPDPAVYAYARRATGALDHPLCLVSSNAWDVIGARSAGLMAIWVQREPHTVFEDWGLEPTATIHSLSELPGVLTQL